MIYSIYDRKGDKMQLYEHKNHKTAKLIVLVLIFIFLILSVLFGYLYLGSFKKIAIIKYPNYTLSEEEWTSKNVIITIEKNDKIIGYSIDNGLTFQEDNTFEVEENGEFNLVVKDINNNLSKSVYVSIENIDKTPPQIIFENNTTVQLNKNFSLRSGVTVTDGDGSGLQGNYNVNPDKIDTSQEGIYTVIYTVFDKVGNYSEKKRIITVTDILGRTYYRYRTSTIVTNKCDVDICKTVTSNTCPSNFVYKEPNQCCQVVKKDCKETVWSDWSEWSQTKVTPSVTREVETKVE